MQQTMSPVEDRRGNRMQPATFELLRGAPFYVNWMKKGTPQGSRALVRIEVYRMPRSSGWELIQALCISAVVGVDPGVVYICCGISSFKAIRCVSQPSAFPWLIRVEGNARNGVALHGGCSPG